MDQVSDLFSSAGEQVNPFPALAQANTAVSGWLQKAFEGRLQESGADALADIQALGSGLATMLGLPTEARNEMYARGEQALQQGDFGQAAAHFTGWVTPFLGPAISEATKDTAGGDWGKGVGTVAGQLVNLLAPFKLNRMATASRGGMVDVAGQPVAPMARQNVPPGFEVSPAAGTAPVTADMVGARLTPPPSMVPSIPRSDVVAFADQAGIPITAGTRAGSEVLKSVQQGNAATSFLAEQVDKAGVARQAQAMQPVGREIARGLAPMIETPETAGTLALDVGERVQAEAGRMAEQVGQAYARTAEGIERRVSPQPVSMYEAGQRQVSELKSVAARLAEQAREHYKAVEEGSKARTEEIVVGYEPSNMTTSSGQPVYQQPITKQVAMPINIAKEKSDLAALYAKLKSEWPIAQQQQSPGFKALENLIQSGEVLALEELDDALGAVKAIIRRTSGRSQGLAKLVVSKLEQAIARTMREADAEPLMAELRAGRAATAKKYEVLELMESLSSEPARAAAVLTQTGDKGAALLRDIAVVAPQASAELGRAIIHELFESMTEHGRLSLTRASAAGRKWASYGAITKRILVSNENTRGQIDRFFQEAQTASKGAVVPKVPESGVQAFNRLVQPHDASVRQLEAFARVSPELPRMLGRAWLEALLDRMFVDPKQLSMAKTALSEWRNMGPRTRRLLFGAVQKDIGMFLQLASEESFVANTSRTAYMSELIKGGFGLIVHNPILIPGLAGVSVSQAALAEMMWRPGGAKLIIGALKTPVASKQAATIASARLINEAKRMGLPVESVPAEAMRGTNILKGNFGGPAAAAGQPPEQEPAAQIPQGTPVGRFMVTEQPPVP